MARGTAKPVSLRGLPAGLVREAKAVAARRGVSLTGLVADTLARAVKEPDSQPISADLESEMRWYERQRARLARAHAGEYVAIRGNAVIDHDESFEALAERVFKRDGARDTFMPRVSAEPVVARIRSPRIASKRAARSARTGRTSRTARAGRTEPRRSR
jgi:hypothetical protein